MNDTERVRIAEAAREAGRDAATRQGLPAKITDPRVVQQIASIIRGTDQDREAA